MNITRVALNVLAVLAILAVVSLFTIALLLLASGPSIEGYAWLSSANQFAPFAAATVVAAQVAAHRPRVARFIPLAVTSIISAGITGGLYLLGSSLVATDTSSQPPALNSLLLATMITGSTLAPVPVIFAIGAVLLAIPPVWHRIRHGFNAGAPQLA